MCNSITCDLALTGFIDGLFCTFLEMFILHIVAAVLPVILINYLAVKSIGEVEECLGK